MQKRSEKILVRCYNKNLLNYISFFSIVKGSFAFIIFFQEDAVLCVI